MNKFILLILLLNAFALTSQIVRFNPDAGSIGVQTPHQSKVHAHLDLNMFSFITGYKVNNINMQLGYTWFNANRGCIRTGGQITFWSITPVIDPDEPLFHYFNIIPISISIYPFSRDYLGIDFSCVFDPSYGVFDIKTAALIRF